MSFIRAFFSAIGFLTILPAPFTKKAGTQDIINGVAFYPIVGLIIGGVQGVVYIILQGQFKALSLVLIVSTLSIILTGGLHFDGLADMFDGFGGGKEKEKIFKIMKDSRIGTFGVLSIIVFLSLKVSILLETKQTILLPVLLLAPIHSRIVQVMLMASYPTAQKEGMAAFFKENLGWKQIITAVLLFLGSTIIIITQLIPGPLYIPIIASSITALILVQVPALYMNRRLEGLSGDIYGGLTEITELLFLTAVVLFSSIFE